MTLASAHFRRPAPSRQRTDFVFSREAAPGRSTPHAPTMGNLPAACVAWP
jgi:hypothetical protein